MKNFILKKKILGICITEGSRSLADISRELNSSIPTITKLVGELIMDGYLEDMGKIDTSGGRRPSIYGLNPSAGFFAGIDINMDEVKIAVTDFKGDLVDFTTHYGFTLSNTEESFKELCRITKEFVSQIGIDTEAILAYGLSLSGRVNYQTGESFTYHLKEGGNIREFVENELKRPVFVENNSRAMTYGEFLYGQHGFKKDILFMNVSWGLGMGMVIDGKLTYGKSGFSGEIGHFPILDNNQICQCGKIGCLETGASCSALQRMITEKLVAGRSSMLVNKFNKDRLIDLSDIMDAIREGDILAIETVEQIGLTLGRAVAGLINLFNSELVVIGGLLSSAAEYLRLPVMTAIQKYTLSTVSRETEIKFSDLGEQAGAKGACMIARSRLLDII
jgi:predicted NBD/HSP70 family sugar kinase